MVINLIRNAFKQYISYPMYFIGEVFGSVFFPIIINCFFIISIISTSDVQIYSDSEMILYIIISNLTYVVTSIDVASEIAKDIKGNGLGKKLLLPRFYFLLIICKAFAKIIVRILCVYIPVFSISIFFLGTNTLLNCILKSIPFLLYSCTVNIMISIIIGLSAFYFTEIWGLKSLINFIGYVLSGSLFPFDLISKSFQNFLLLTPFPYISYIPTKVIIDSAFSIGQFMYWIPLFYILLFLIMITAAWKFGIRRYQSCGV